MGGDEGHLAIGDKAGVRRRAQTARRDGHGDRRGAARGSVRPERPERPRVIGLSCDVRVGRVGGRDMGGHGRAWEHGELQGTRTQQGG